MENQKEYSRLQQEINKLNIEIETIKQENKEIFDKIDQVENAKKLLQERQILIQDEILKEYDSNKLNAEDIYEDNIVKIKYSPSYDKTLVDSKKLQEQYEEVYLDCLKKSTVKSSIKVTIK